MHGRGVVFTAQERAELEPVEVDPGDLRPGEALVRGEYSIVSAGTEGAAFKNVKSNRPPVYPVRPGYGHLGEVLAVAAGETTVEPGDRVLTFSRHASVVAANVGRFAMKVPKHLDGRQVVFTRMAGVGISALRSSTAGPGDTVAVLGLGLVGNLAAQLFQLAGCDVIAFDTVPRRLQIARACGIENVHRAAEVDPVEATRQWTADTRKRQGAHVVVDAIGNSDCVAQAVEMAGRHGEVLLLGSPREPSSSDFTPTLVRIHELAIRMIGALEWTFPIPGETERARHTIEQNYRHILRWIADGRLVAEPLRTHVLTPDDCQQAYSGLADDKDGYVGVVFDWTREPTSRSSPRSVAAG